MNPVGTRFVTGAAVALLALAALPSAQAGQEETLRAFSAWQSQGQMLRTGPNQAMFTGLVSGRFYVDTDNGPVDAGDLTCPVTIFAKLDDNSQRALGQCVLTDLKDNRLYLDLTCAGTALAGCEGESTVTGGTGQFEHATGGGHFVVRSSAHTFVIKGDGTLKDSGTGVIFWPKLHYKAP
jgi:hypothetical protein